MKGNKISYLSLVLAAIAILIAVFHAPYGRDAGRQKKETAYERVMRTGTIRCGYAVWSPVIYKDLKTGEVRGIARDVMDAMGKKLEMKIDWAEEAGWGTIVEGLSTGRYDMICVGLARLAARARVIDFSDPLLFASGYMLVRNNDTRFKRSEDLNDPSHTLIVLEGEAASILARQKYPKVRIKGLPPATDYSLLFQELEARKADATIMELATFKEYEKNNPGKLRILDKNHPEMVVNVAFGLPQGDVAFKTMIDAALLEAMSDGTVDAAIRAHAVSSDAFFRPAKPYVLPE